MNATAIRAAFNSQPTAADLDHARMAYGRWGAHRAYLTINGLTDDKAMFGYDSSKVAKNKAAKAVTAAGHEVRKCYGISDRAVYLGYSNFDGGKDAARGAAIARALKELGISASVDAAGD